MGSVLAKRNIVKIKNNLEEIMPKASGGIVVRKEANFDIICFDINIEGFYPTRVHYGHKISRPASPRLDYPWLFPALTLLLTVSNFINIKKYDSNNFMQLY